MRVAVDYVSFKYCAIEMSNNYAYVTFRIQFS